MRPSNESAEKLVSIAFERDTWRDVRFKKFYRGVTCLLDAAPSAIITWRAECWLLKDG